MSKKNNRHTAANYHNFTLERERVNQLKKDKKAKKTNDKLAAGGKVKKTAHKGIRLRKGVRVRGIRITDAESKQEARKLLAAEQAMQGMEVDEWEEVEEP